MLALHASLICRTRCWSCCVRRWSCRRGRGKAWWSAASPETWGERRNTRPRSEPQIDRADRKHVVRSMNKIWKRKGGKKKSSGAMFKSCGVRANVEEGEERPTRLILRSLQHFQKVFNMPSWQCEKRTKVRCGNRNKIWLTDTSALRAQRWYTAGRRINVTAIVSRTCCWLSLCCARCVRWGSPAPCCCSSAQQTPCPVVCSAAADPPPPPSPPSTRPPTGTARCTGGPRASAATARQWLLIMKARSFCTR